MEAYLSRGAWLQRRRKALDLTQAALGQLVGISVAMIRRLEADERRPSLDVAARLAEALRIPMEERATFLKVARGDLAADHLPLASMQPPVDLREGRSPQRRHNLPAQTTPLIGRDHEVAAVTSLLRQQDVRLLTMTGVGGVGKTRLALAVAHALQHDFTDGVWFVDLAPTREPALVMAAIAQVVGVKERGGQPLLESLQASLRDKHLVLVLDNFEQVTSAAPLVADLLKAAPRLKVLVTSREALHLRGEQEYPVPPLPLPELEVQPLLEDVAQNAAVALFIQRAQAVNPEFALTAQNALAVAEICVRLDGLPLAIELAAARIKLLPPEALLQRLAGDPLGVAPGRLKVLTGGARDLPDRQRTLRSMIDWSYQLLDPEEQMLFRRLAVFVGGWSLAAAAAVGSDDGGALDILDRLASLVDKSLVAQRVTPDGDARFRMLETIREFASEQLAAAGETAACCDRHLAFFLQYVEDGAAEGMPGERYRIDQDNLRAALEWALGGRNVVMGARLLHATSPYALQYAKLTEWRTWLERALLSQDLLPAVLHAQIFFMAARAAQWHSQADSAAVTRLRESRALFQAAGDTRGEANALHQLGRASRGRGDYEAATAALEEAQALYQALGDTNRIADVTGSLGAVALYQAAFPRAVVLYEQAVVYCRKSLAVFRRLDVPILVAWSLHNAGYVADRQDATVLARACFRESLSLFQDHELLDGIGVCLAGFARLAVSAGQADRATRLLGAAEAVAARIGGLHFPMYRAEKSRTVATARALLCERTFTAAWSEGQAMTLEQAIAYALEETTPAEP